MLPTIGPIQRQRSTTVTAVVSLHVELDDDAREWLAARGYNPEFGARPLKRLLQRAILDPISTKILEGECSPGTRLSISVVEGELAFDSAHAH